MKHMNRVIKFRAWHTEDFPIPEYRNTMLKWEDMSLEGVLDGVKHGNMVIMQYTGLKDKNGVDIYEGDVDSSNYVCYVE